MSLYAIGDLHLSISSDKPMDIFGNLWEEHMGKLHKSFLRLSDEDVTVICGDLSWGMDLSQAKDDLLFVESLPGKKIILKGNHDYWWTTMAKTNKFFLENSISSIDIMHNSSFVYGDNTAICGTRGWFYEEENRSDHDKKILRREVARLETSLKSAGDKDKYVFLHYPPKYGGYECSDFLDLFKKYNVKYCVYAHIHGKSLRNIFEGEYRGTIYKCVSADNVDFTPQMILE